MRRYDLRKLTNQSIKNQITKDRSYSNDT